MKFKSKSKESKSGGRKSKVVDELLEEEIQCWAGNSFTSIASSVTAPPSQTASFYKKALQGLDFDSDSDGSSVSEKSASRSSDDNMSWADSRSEDGGGDSLQAVKKSSKKDKKKKSRRGRRRFFGAGTIEEEGQDGEKEEAPQPGRRRRGSLFGNASSDDNNEISRYSQSTDGEFSVNQSDDGGNLSTDGDDNLGYEDAAPTISRGKTKRRGSLGGLFSKKHESKGGGGRSEDGSYATRSHEGSNDELGCEDATPTISRGKTKRRGSLGGLFSKKHESKGGGGRSEDGSYATRSHDGSNDELGYEDATPTISRGKTKRRGSLGGLFSKTQPEPDATEQPQEGQNRRRRNSLSAFDSASEHIPESRKHNHEHGHEMSATTHSTKTHKKAGRRRQSLTGSSYKRDSTKSVGPPKDIHRIVNKERTARGMNPFERNAMLDVVARSMCNEMSAGLPPTPTEFYGNVGRGDSLQNIHATIMEDRGGISRKNILTEKFTAFGMALTLGNDGQYYMVALFKE
jgi:hypothetical protein